MDIRENERIDYVNDSLSLIQKTDGLTFGTDALLLAGYVTGKYGIAAELGGGSGIISMLLLTREKCAECDCYEVQKDYAELISRNAKLNNLAERLHSVCADVRELKANEKYDLVFTNPPYMKATSGAHNRTDAKSIARHELNGDIEDFTRVGASMLKYGGTYAVVYRPDRLVDLISALRKSKLEPKRITFVHASEDSEPSMVLITAKKGGRSGARVTPPLIIYKDKAHREYGDSMCHIMEHGSFPEKYL